jgi:probable blue pigment (indigoidine) exporter
VTQPLPAHRAGLSPGRRHLVALVAAAACWGLGTVASKQAVAEIAPLTLLPIQLAASVVFLLVLTRARGIPLPAGREGRLLGRLGLLNPGLAYALSLIGLAEITASLSVLLWATEPLFILALAAVVLGERIGVAILAPSAVSIAGLALVVLDPAAGGSTLGISLTVAGVVVCAIYTVATRKLLLGSDSTFGVVLAQQLYALGFAALVVVSLAATGREMLPAGVSGAGLASAVTSGLLYYAFAYSFYISALRHVSASIAAASFYLIPVFGVAGGWLAGERLEPVQWVGAILVVLSVAAITIRVARPADERADQPSSADASAQIALSPSDASRS